jgi:uncharacterized protein (TIGR02172 family)
MLEIKSHSSADGRGVLVVVGRVDTNTSAQLSDAVDKARESGAKSLEMDFSGVDYISSSGLRAVLAAAKAFENLKVTHSSADIYEIFETTGFTDMIQVQKPLRKISLSGREIIGKGAVGTIYRLDEERIVKVYEPHVSVGIIDRERKNAREAFKCGLPCAITYDTVEVDGRIGVVYELFQAETLASLIEGDRASTTSSVGWMNQNMAASLHSAHIAKYAAELSKIAKKMHSTDASGTGIQSVQDLWLGWTDLLKGVATDAQIAEIRRRILSVEAAKTFVHGDLHPKNVMVQNGEYLLVDMGDVGYGNPIFDLAVTCVCLDRSSQKMSQETALEIYGMPPAVCREFYREFIKSYAAGTDPKALQEQIDKLVDVREVLWVAQHQPHRVQEALAGF